MPLVKQGILNLISELKIALVKRLQSVIKLKIVILWQFQIKIVL